MTTDKVCYNQGTWSNADDKWTVEVTVNRSSGGNNSTQWIGNAPLSNAWTNYGASKISDYALISAGNRTITGTDSQNSGCSTSQSVAPPPACSVGSCSLSISVTSSTCDAGTDNIPGNADDEWTLVVSVTVPSGSDWELKRKLCDNTCSPSATVVASGTGSTSGVTIGPFTRADIDAGTNANPIGFTLWLSLVGYTDCLTDAWQTFPTSCPPSCNMTTSLNTPSPKCTGQSVTFTATTSNPPGSVTYTWSGPGGWTGSNSSTVSRSPLTTSHTGTYSVTATSSGCTATASTYLEVNPPPAGGASSNSPLCTGQTLNLSAYGGTTYNWTGPSGFTSTSSSPTRTPAVAGTYNVTVTDSGTGCSTTANTLVVVNTNPTVVVSYNLPLCVGQTINLFSTVNPTGGAFSWAGPNGFSSSAEDPTINSATSANNGTYTLIYTTSSGCSATASTVVTINNSPNATVSNNGPKCEGQTLILTATGGGTYSWTAPDGATSSSATFTRNNVTTAMSGNYTVVVTNSQGCSVTLNTNATINPSPVASASNTGPYCVGNTIQLSATGGGTYSWSGPSSFSSTSANPTRSNATTSMTGVYTVTVTIGSCSSIATTSVVVNNNPTTTAVATPSSCSGSTPNNDGKITLFGFTTEKYDYNIGSTYSGSATYATATTIPGNGVITSSLPNPGSNTNYTVRIFNSSGCYVDRVITLIPVNCSCPTIAAPSITGASRCGNGYVTFTVTTACVSPNVLKYYTDPTLTTEATGFSGNTTPSLSVTTTYYAACVNTSTNCKSAAIAVTATINPIPSFTASAIQVTCTNGVPNSDGKLQVFNVTNGDKVGYSIGSSYTGPAYASASTIPSNGVIVSTLANPSSPSQTYTIRVFNGSNTCFYDQTVTLNYTDCSSCQITAINLSNLSCNSNGTNGNSSDDYITFTLNPSGTNLGSYYTVDVSAGTVNPAVGTYGTTTTFTMNSGSANGSTIIVNVTDGTSSSCTFSTNISQNSCSNCNLNVGLVSTSCNNNNTTNVTTDDRIVFTINPTMTGASGNYNVSVSNGTLDFTWGTFGTPKTFTMQPGSANGTNITVTVTKDACNVTFVLNQSHCSGCSITPNLQDITCDNNSTSSSPSDDRIKFKLNPTVSSGNTSYTITVPSGVFITPSSPTYSYGTLTQFSLHSGSAASGINYVLTITDSANPNCKTTVIITNPGTCSPDPPCNININLANICCDNNGTSNDGSDDRVTFELTPTNSLGLSTGTYVVEAAVAATNQNLVVDPGGGTMGVTTKFTLPVGSANLGNININVFAGCNATTLLTNPGPCVATKCGHNISATATPATCSGVVANNNASITVNINNTVNATYRIGYSLGASYSGPDYNSATITVNGTPNASYTINGLPNPTTRTLYTIRVWNQTICGNSILPIKGCGTTCSCYQDVVVMLLPTICCAAPAPVVNSAERCGPGSVNLTVASGCGSGFTLYYFDDATLANQAQGFVGNTTPNITTTTTYYPACLNDTDKSCLTEGNPVVVTIEPAPDISITSPTSACLGAGNISLSGGSTDPSIQAYNWSGPNSFTSSSQTISIPALVANSGTYILTITNKQGCTASASTTLTITSPPTAILGLNPSITCGANEIGLAVAGSGGTSVASAFSMRAINSNIRVSAIWPSSANLSLVQQTDAYANYEMSKWVFVDVATNQITTPIDGGIYYIRNKSTTRNLSPVGGATSNGTLIESVLSITTTQRWTVNIIGGQYRFTHTSSGKVMQVVGASNLEWANYELGTDSGASHQRFSLTSAIVYNYSWSNSLNNNLGSHVVMPSATTNYTVFITDGSGCTGTANWTAYINSPISASLPSSSICAGSSITLTPTVTSYPVTAYSLQSLQTPSNCVGPSNANALLDEGTVANAACASVDRQRWVITDLALGGITGYPTNTYGTVLGLRNANSGMYLRPQQGASPANGSTLVQDDVTIPTANPHGFILDSTGAGQFKIRHYSSGKCLYVSSGTLLIGDCSNNTNPYIFNFTNPTSINKYFVNWNNGLGTGTSKTVSPTTTTSYDITVTSLSGCTTTASGIVTVNAIPSAPTGIPASRCGTGTVTLGASGCSGGTINWYAAASGGTSLGTGTSFTTPSIASTTTYYVECTLNGCVSARTAVIATVGGSPVATAAGSTVCVGGTITLTSGGGTSYAWSGPNSYSNNTQNPSISSATLAMAGTYTVTVSNASACTAIATATVTVVNDPTITTQPSNASVCGSGTQSLTVTASGGTPTLLYQWQYYNGSTWANVANGTPTGAIYSGNTTNAVTITGISTAGSYQYRVSISATGNGCGSVNSTTVTLTVINPVNTGTGSSTTVCKADYGTNNTNLATLILGASSSSGTWTSLTVPSSLTTTIVNNKLTGSILNRNGLPSGTYTFRYNLIGTAPCPNDTEDVTVIINACCLGQFCLPTLSLRN